MASADSTAGDDWHAWHRRYDDPRSSLSQRLVVVQGMVRKALHLLPAGPIRAVSICAGQGRDLLEVLATHRRKDDVSARLVELDPRNAEVARASAEAAGLEGIEVVEADAGVHTSYEGAVPADLVLLCGVLGNLADDDVEATIAALPHLCAPGAIVIWTRHRRDPDLTPRIRSWLEVAGFDEIAFADPAETRFGVGSARFVGEPRPLEAGQRLFTFIGYETLLAPSSASAVSSDDARGRG
jgi:hypothetical protein